jgi:GMP synthase (glutamine-hydrolysing)
MKTLCVLQHVESEYLGLLEDQLEGRNIGFRYCRPFTPGGQLPAEAGSYDGLIVLGAGPLGIVSGNLIPSLAAELRFVVTTAHRTTPAALGGHLPETWPAAIFMRDRPALPRDAQVLAVDEAGEPLVFQIGTTGIGFLGHPGIKPAMVEDLIMEFGEAPDDTAETLEALRGAYRDIEAALIQIMVGLVDMTHWMSPSR